MGLVNTQYLIIDWGTTNFRAFAMSENDQLIETLALNMGLLQIEDGKFGETLSKALNKWMPNYENKPIYMAGMVGSAKGWVNVDYTYTKADLNGIIQKAHFFDLPWGAKAVITPGVSHCVNDQFDVMRGEEVQIFGLATLKNSSEFSAILPGTHSKHIQFQDNKLVQFESFLTGEFFSIITKHSLIGKGLVSGKEDKTEVFKKGVEHGQNGALTNRIFLGWTNRLFGLMDESDILDYVSGMLIGYELRHFKEENIYLVGGKGLCERYSIACEMLNIKNEIIDGDTAFLAGMVELKKGIAL